MKKLYSNTLMQLIVALCTFSFVACQEYSIDSQPEGPLNIQIDAQDSYTALATSPSNVVFSISSNTPWTIESDKQWCTVTPSMSASSSLVSEIVVSMENNDGKQSRTAKLTVKAEGISSTKVITIEQASKEDLVVIRPTDIVPTEGGTVTFNIISNKPWEIIPETQFLENIDKTSGTGNETGEKEMITITVPENTGAVRSATITVKTAFQQETFTVTQDGIIIEPKNEEEVTNQLDGMGGEKTIEINASVEWKVEVPDEYKEWLSAEADGNNLKLVTKYNNLFVVRTGHVLLYPKMNVPGFEGVPVEVTQPRNIWVDGAAESIDPETGYSTIQSTEKSRFVTNFIFKKGRLVWTLDNVDIPSEDGVIDINFDTWWGSPAKGGGWIHAYLRPDFASSQSKLQLSAPWIWSDDPFTITDINAIKTIELVVEEDVNNVGKASVVLLINGEEAVRYDNRNDIYLDDPDLNQGQKIYFGFTGKATPTCTLTFKSFDYYPAE